MTCIADKFGIISKSTFNTEIKKRKFIENYLNDNLICHPELIKHQPIATNELIGIIRNHLRKHKTSIMRLVKYNKISMDDIIELTLDSKRKFKYIKNLCSEFPNSNQFILNIVLLNSGVDKILMNNFVQHKSIKKFMDTFKLLDTNNEYMDELESKLSKIIIDNIPKIDSNNLKFKNLWELDSLINYFLFIINKYNYFQENVLKDTLSTIEISVGKNIIDDNNNFLEYLKNNYKKINTLLSLDIPEGKKIQESLLFYRPHTFSELYDFINIICNINIDNKTSIIDNFIKLHKNLINEDDISLLVDKINNNIINKRSNKANYEFIKNVKYNQDIVIAYNSASLMKRWIYYDDFDFSYEEKEYNLMLKTLPKNILYKYTKVFTDIRNNENNNIPYLYNEMKTKLISKSIWNLDYSKGGYYKSRVFDLHHIVDDNFVPVGTEERRYNILLHLGEIITDFKTNKGTFEIRMLPLHYHIINNPNDFVTNLHNYDPKFFKKPKLYETDYLNKIFNQLVQNNILEMTNATPEGCFQINKDYDGGDLDLIELLDEYEENDSIIKTMMKEVSLERKEIIMANVNSFLKKYDYYVKKIDVYKNVNETLKVYFDVEQEYFDNIINEMVNKEYICYDNKETFNLKKLI